MWTVSNRQGEVCSVSTLEELHRKLQQFKAERTSYDDSFDDDYAVRPRMFNMNRATMILDKLNAGKVPTDGQQDLVTQIKIRDSFISRYTNRHPNWGFGGLGYIIYLRTYARKHEDKTLETWQETVRRFTEGNFKIEAKRLAELGKLTAERVQVMQAEMEEFYDHAFNLIHDPPGRGVWMSGTKYAEKVGDAENNCWLVAMRPQAVHKGEDKKVSTAAVFTFDQAMKGGGVGVNVQRKNVEQMPEVASKLHIDFVVHKDHKDVEELRALGVHVYDELKPASGILRVHDSREGWAESLGVTVDAHFQEPTNDKLTGYATIDVSDVRPRDSEIKGFGGVASGPGPLVKMLDQVNQVLNSCLGRKLTSTEWGDIIQLIGTCVVAGNVRRTALILIGDEQDKQFVESKNYSLPQNLVASQWRWASNNSVDIGPNTKRAVLKELARNIYFNGEPGYVNIELAQNYGRIIDGFDFEVDADVEGFNPCGEVPLPNMSPCNLYELNLVNIEKWIRQHNLDDAFYERATALAVRYAYRVTFREYEWEGTRDVVYKHRRLGIGVTGVTDWVLLKFGESAITGYTKDGDPIFNKKVTDILDRMYAAGRAANKLHAAEMGADISIKITTVKPSGTMSLVQGTSPGMHFHWSAWMIRTVRIPASHMLSEVLARCGYRYEYLITGRDADNQKVYDYRTLVFEFPVEAPSARHPLFRSAGQVSMEEQFAIQALLAYHWADNAVSATINFTPNPDNPEAVIEQITDNLFRYKDKIKSTSLLPYAAGTYDQMPYQAITEAEYVDRVAEIKASPWDLLAGKAIAEIDEEEDTSAECAGGFCPVK